MITDLSHEVQTALGKFVIFTTDKVMFFLNRPHTSITPSNLIDTKRHNVWIDWTVTDRDRLTKVHSSLLELLTTFPESIQVLAALARDPKLRESIDATGGFSTEMRVKLCGDLQTLLSAKHFSQN